MLSMTITDLSGRNLSGHTVEAFWHAVRHARPVTIGLNCSFGAEQLRPHVRTLADNCDALVMVYPNAGLPNDLGAYDERRRPPPSLSANGPGAARSTSSAAAADRPRSTSAPSPISCAICRPARCRKVPVKTRLAGLEPMVIAA